MSFPTPGDLPDTGIEPASPALTDSLPLRHLGNLDITQEQPMEEMYRVRYVEGAWTLSGGTFLPELPLLLQPGSSLNRIPLGFSGDFST